MNKLIIRYVVEKGHNVVGVVGRHNISEDPFDVAGLKDTGLRGINATPNLQIVKESGSEQLITSSKPDVCIVATCSTVADVAPVLTLLGSQGLNVITIAEEAFYPVNT